jgi:hypothetical protein
MPANVFLDLPVCCHDSPFQCLGYALDFFVVFLKDTPEYTVNVGVTRHFALDLVPGKFHQMSDERFNVFQVIDSLDAEYNETVPFACVAIFHVPFDAAKKVGRQSDVIELVFFV